eukprot:CAMPEP_0169459140 /NCGR_PEP_ID=MMETSP1042-20121227/17804_1 /TAXON_ID=464988 /ORGANISM="Hemiselmis andersenii, Strain CCMP1180" /LENGTH=272 /DNA_ID=CAMNT_0009571563 /DNA_START=40 /DNA_END=858 /DNA_ORIENTATION=+
MTAAALALPSHSPLHNKPLPMQRLRGGEGVPLSVLTPATIGIHALQGASLYVDPQGNSERYGSQLDKTPTADYFRRVWGGNMLCSTVIMIGTFYLGLPINKALAVAQACFILHFSMLLKYHHLVPVPDADVYGWIAILSAVAYVNWNDGAGLVDVDVFAKYWAVFLLASSALMAPFPNLVAKGYGISGATEGELLIMIHSITAPIASMGAFVLGYPKSPSLGVAGYWGVTMLQSLWAVLFQHWRKLRHPNGLPMLAWLLVASGGAYATYAQQ